MSCVDFESTRPMSPFLLLVRKYFLLPPFRSSYLQHFNQPIESCKIK